VEKSGSDFGGKNRFQILAKVNKEVRK